ncbi:MAG: hypothetical protein CMM48_17505 [Rhodospirillaceae bacterium]|nr:hypothetical protein [Rhodospirillaceae bacterium]HAA91698.1 hypothetical protein [Rhodospirillaceae bacterium]
MRRRHADPDLRDPYDGIADLESVLAKVKSAESYYTHLFEWRTDFTPKLYLFTHVAPMINGRFLVYPYDNPRSKFGIILNKNELNNYLKEEIRKDDTEAHTPTMSIVAWSIFFFMICVYFFPIYTALFIGIAVFTFWMFLRNRSKKSLFTEFNEQYGKFDKYYGDNYRKIRPIIGDFIYKRRVISNIYMDLFLSISAFICVCYVLYFFLAAKNYFVAAAALVGLLYLGAICFRAARSLVVISRFRRNVRRDPTYRDLADLTPEAPRAPRFS